MSVLSNLGTAFIMGVAIGSLVSGAIMNREHEQELLKLHRSKRLTEKPQIEVPVQSRAVGR